MCAAVTNGKFRRLLAGRVVTNLGDSVYFVAAMWLVHDLTGNPFYTGLAGFLTLTPSAFQFLAGPLADRWRVRRTLVGTQLVQGVIVLSIPIAHRLDALTVGLVLLVMPILASLNQLANPSMVSALPRLLDDDELVGANSALAIAKQGVDMVGYGVSGVLMGVFGAVTLFALDAATFALAAVLFATVAVPAANDPAFAADEPAADGSDRSSTGHGDEPAAEAAPGVDGSGDDAPYLTQLRLGFEFLRGTFLVWLIVGVAVVNFAAGMALAVMPAYADTLAVPALLVGIGATGAYGILMAAFATGNFLGAIAANLVTDRPLGRTLAVGFTAGSGCWIAAIGADWLPATALLLTAAFVPVGIVNVQIAALIQSAPPEAVVGRVSSVLGAATAATIPVGSLVGGAVAGATGPEVAMLLVGFGLVVLAGYVLAVPGLRTLPVVDRIDVEPA